METDVAIIGAGPIGLEMAVALKRARVDYVHFDAGQVGQTIAWLFPPQTRFFSSPQRIAIAGVPLQTPDQNKATREEYLAYLRGVVQQFALDVRTYEPVVTLERRGERFALTTRPASGETLTHCRRIILATGGTAKPRNLGVTGEDLPHVSHFLRDPHAYFNRRVLVVGGKNSAVESALRLHNVGAHVSISYRRGEFDPKNIKYWLLPEIRGLIASGAIGGHFNTCVARINPSDVALISTSGVAGTTVKAESVLLMTGYFADMSLCRLAGVELIGECEQPVFNPQTMESNVPGVYLAGTVTGGTQDKYAVFIENGHVHIERILAAITGASAPVPPAPYEEPES